MTDVSVSIDGVEAIKLSALVVPLMEGDKIPPPSIVRKDTGTFWIFHGEDRTTSRLTMLFDPSK